MNPAEIYDALAAKPYDPVAFPFEFAAATDNNPGTIAKLRNGSFNKSDLPDGVLMNQKFHFVPALPGMAAVTIDQLRAKKRTFKHKPAILIATDGVPAGVVLRAALARESGGAGDSGRELA